LSPERSRIQQSAGNNGKNHACGWSFLVISTVFVVDYITPMRTRRFAASNRMNSTSAQIFSKRPPKRGRIGRLLPATLIILLLTAVPALAEPITVNQVVQTLTSSQGVLDLRLSTLAQDPAKGTQQSGPRGESVAKTQGPTQTGGKTESIISGVIVTAEGASIGVEDIEEGEVEGTICDCGEIFIAGAGIPKWPFLFLAAVPVVFINDCCDETTDSSPTPTPTPPSNPSPTPVPTPEPASLLLFGSGLLAAGAGLRRRYKKSKTLEQIKEDE
jgi:PEP-CTERM motif-containing protein